MEFRHSRTVVAPVAKSVETIRSPALPPSEKKSIDLVGAAGGIGDRRGSVVTSGTGWSTARTPLQISRLDPSGAVSAYRIESSLPLRSGAS